MANPAIRFRTWELLLFGLLGLCPFGNSWAKTSRIAGVSLVSPSRVVTDSWTSSLCRIHADWVAVQPYGFSYPGKPEVYHDLPQQWWGERIEGARVLVRQAHQNGINVMLKPMVWIPGSWVGAYDLATEQDWSIWEAGYRDYVLQYAQMAQEEGVALFCVGTEFNAAASKRPTFWRKLIQDVRAIFKGKLTYAANWDHFHEVQFWDALDFIGVDAYFPLSDAKSPQVGELLQKWKDPAYRVYLLYKLLRKPVLFTEFGYRSIDRCTWKQWEIEHVPYDQQVNLQAQVNAYRAFFQSFWHLDWFAGVFLWQWYTSFESAGGAQNSDYTPQNKPAEDEICRWFAQ